MEDETFKVIVASIPMFIENIINKIKKIRIRDKKFIINIEDYIDIVERKIQIVCYYFKQLNREIDINIYSDYPNTKLIITTNSKKQLLKDFEDIKFLIFCEFNENTKIIQ